MTRWLANSGIKRFDALFENLDASLQQTLSFRNEFQLVIDSFRELRDNLEILIAPTRGLLVGLGSLVSPGPEVDPPHATPTSRLTTPPSKDVRARRLVRNIG